LHADHMGLAGRLGCKVNISWIDAEIAIRYFIHPEHWKELGEFYIKNGFPADEAIKVTKIHPAVKYSSNILQPNFLSDGDTLEFGGYMLEALHTPGHTPGHLCLYDEEKGILFSGDHILFDITPNITYWDSMDNALERYLKSLEKIYELEVTITLPGHRSFHGNHRKRIEEIKQHHQKRLKETLDAVKNGSRTAWEVAQKITWDMKYNSWHELPTMQKWFAVGETIAHLLYLEKKGEIRREEAEKILYYPP
ncbi:MAG: MBL fold metallo-hydrolase, partial [Archaeoglobaceae archaeon]|nr:MBL fold metallo-hydrolase [Archaeoglobaceae archaeon]